MSWHYICSGTIVCVYKLVRKVGSKSKLHVMQVDEGLSRSDILAQSIFETGHNLVVRINVKDDLRLYVEKFNPDLIMIEMEYPNEDILNKIAYINDYMSRPVMFFSDHSESNVIDLVVKAGVSAFVVDGLSAVRIKPVIDVAIARFEQSQLLKNELMKTRETLAERKLIDRAKGILMKQRNMDESMAYKTLRTLAMNQNKKIGFVAKEVIDVAGLLLN